MGVEMVARRTLIQKLRQVEWSDVVPYKSVLDEYQYMVLKEFVRESKTLKDIAISIYEEPSVSTASSVKLQIVAAFAEIAMHVLTTGDRP